MSIIIGNTKYKNIIPIMTSNTEPAPYTVSGNVSSTENSVYKAFDNNSESYARNSSQNVLPWIIITDLGEGNEQLIKAYSISNYHNPIYSPQDWTFEGSNNSVDWDILHTVTGKTSDEWEADLEYSYEIENETSYRYYRINITSQTSTSSECTITEIALLTLDETSLEFIKIKEDNLPTNKTDGGDAIYFTDQGNIYMTTKSDGSLKKMGGSPDVSISQEENNALELKDDGLFVDGTDIAGTDGVDGKSAYEVWLELGNTGTEEDFINSLKGEDGTDGSDGKSAYEVWLDLGNTGTEEDFINSLKGEDGTDGAAGSDGKSAYEVWLELGNTGTEEDFINSLKGEDGADGADLINDDTESNSTTWSSEKIKTEIDGSTVSISSVTINDSKHMILYMSDGTTRDAGLLKLEEDYTLLSNIPKINGVDVVGDVSLEGLGIHDHSNLAVLEDFSTDGQDLFFKGVNVTNIILEDGKRSYPVVILDAKADNVYQINISSNYKECDLVVQTWKFVDGETDILSIIKYFDNTNKGNFYCSDNILFTMDSCSIKDNYSLQAYTVDSNGLYATEEINLSDFKEIINIK